MLPRRNHVSVKVRGDFSYMIFDVQLFCLVCLLFIDHIFRRILDIDVILVNDRLLVRVSISED